MSRIEVVRDPAGLTGPGTELNFTVKYGLENKEFTAFVESELISSDLFRYSRTFKKFDKTIKISLFFNFQALINSSYQHKK